MIKRNISLKVIPVTFFMVVCAVVIFISCNNEKSQGAITEENLTSGTATMYVDSSVQPVVEDVLAVFMSRYANVNLKQVNLPETDIIRLMMTDSAKIAVLTRKLTKQEEQLFAKLKIEPKITEFASDAVALVAQKGNDTVVNLAEVLKLLQGKPSTISKIVFDNPGSGAVQFLMSQAGVTSLPSENIYALKSNAEVLKYVKNNKGTIGVIGLNMLVQPPKDVASHVEGVEVLSVSGVKNNGGAIAYYKPNQSNIAAGLYPLTRKIYVLNYQGKLGLGMGFANYATSPDGQRIVLKAGLLPVTMPTREIEVRNEL